MSSEGSPEDPGGQAGLARAGRGSSRGRGMGSLALVGAHAGGSAVTRFSRTLLRKEKGWSLGTLL